MDSKKGIAFFDFDGTLTQSDSFWHFIRFSQPILKILLGGIRFAPQLLAMKLGWLSNQVVKGMVLRFFYRGWTKERLKKVSESFAREEIDKILRPGATERVKWHQSQEHEVCLVSASLEHYLIPWCRNLGIHCLATSLKIEDGRVLGTYDHPNCYGSEKERRIKEVYNLDSFDEVYAYGDSPGDQEMLALADHRFFRSLK